VPKLWPEAHVLNLFNHTHEKNNAISTINITSNSTVVAIIEAVRDKNNLNIFQPSQGGAAYFCGNGVDNKNQKASIAGAIAAAHYIRSVASVYGIPVILHTNHCEKKILP
jgi:fructose-bisphosphate aldolase class II